RFFFFFNDTATTEIYTLSLHDALPIYHHRRGSDPRPPLRAGDPQHGEQHERSEEHTSEPSHTVISYAVFCLKKKKAEVRARGCCAKGTQVFSFSVIGWGH